MIFGRRRGRAFSTGVSASWIKSRPVSGINASKVAGGMTREAGFVANRVEAQAFGALRGRKFVVVAGSRLVATPQTRASPRYPHQART